MTDPPLRESLAELREEIDRIDAELHRLLMERGEIIDRLIAAKARQGGGSAFRPGREADMMRGLVSRHKGILPLDTVESIWRIIISTFTYVQSSYCVHGDISGGDAQMRDCCRFHFGFTVPFEPQDSAVAVIEAVARSTGDLGLVPVEPGPSSGPWWQSLVGPAAPKIIARLPFVERPDHPAGLPLFVVARPLSEAAARDVVLYAVVLDRWPDLLPSDLDAAETEILGLATDGVGVDLLVAIPGDRGCEAFLRTLAATGSAQARIDEIGGHAARFDLVATTRSEAAAREAAQ
jgi:chorismate mutase